MTAKTLKELMHDFDHALQQPELDVELLTQLFAEVVNRIKQFQAEQHVEQINQLSESLDWITTRAAQVKSYKLVVAKQLKNLQKQRLASKSYSSNQ